MLGPAKAFGAAEHFVVAGEGREIAHAQLLIGDGLFMLGSSRKDVYQMRTPAQLGGAYTQTLNLYVDAPDAPPVARIPSAENYGSLTISC